MRVIVVAVKGLTYEEFALERIREYYRVCGIPISVIDEIPDCVEGKLPSWIKYFGHTMYDEDFLLFHDLDLIPVSLRESIVDHLDVNKFNFALDPYGVEREDWGILNCGLCGIPRQYAAFCLAIFDQYKNNPHHHASAGDQHYMNHALKAAADEVDIHVLPRRYNVFWRPRMDYRSVMFCHYTGAMKSCDKFDVIKANHPENWQ